MTGAFTLPSTITTARLMLRAVEIEDAKDIFAYGSDPMVTRYVTWPTHRTMEDAIDFANRCVRQRTEGPQLTWAISEGVGKPAIGGIAIHDINERSSCCELGYVLAQPFWGRGYMSEATRGLIDAIFRHTPMNRIQARCLTPNRASARVMEKSGMSFEGVMRDVDYFKERYHDAHFWAILRIDWLSATGR